MPKVSIRPEMKTLVAISGYSGDQHQIESNWPCYAHHKAPVLILSPKDAPVGKIHDSRNFSAGRKGWIGPHTLDRQKMFLRELMNQSAEFYLFHDADSVCLSPSIPQYLYAAPDVFWSNQVTDTNTSPSMLPKLAFQPPYFFSQRVLRLLMRTSATPAQSFTVLTAQGSMPLPTECIDHFMLQLVYAAGLQHRSFPDGSSWETSSDLGLNQMSIHVRTRGKIFIHQVKSRAVLDRLMSDRSTYLKNHR